MSSPGEHVVDRLNSMPQDVLSYILSPMPTKFAVRTSLLSKALRYTWTFIHNLNFDTSEDHIYFYPKDADWVLKRSKTSQVKIFRVHFSPYYNSESYSEELISNLIRLNVHELDMKGEYLRLPRNLYTCKTLTKLKLDCIKSPIMDTFPSCPYLVNLPNLKTIDVIIDDIYWESALKLIHGCLVLENLYVNMGCSKGDTYFKILTLKRLDLQVNQPYSKLVTDIVVLNLPNLEYFMFVGYMVFPFVIEDMSYLIEAKASCVAYHADRLVQLLKAISQAKSISLNTKQLKLECYVGHQWNLMPQFLERSPKLEHLSIGTALRKFRWNKLKPIPPCMRVNLKTMKYTNGCGYHELEFLNFTLSYLKVLQTLTIECGTKSSMVLCANLTKL